NAVDYNPGTAAGHYMYTETSGGVLGALAIMESPRLDALGVGAPRVTYAYHMFGASMGMLHTDIVELFNEGTNGVLSGTTFTSATANFAAAHVGSEIVISGSGAGNDGTYLITLINSPASVEVGTAFPAAESNVNYLHQLTSLDVIPVKAGNMGNMWFTQPVTVPMVRGGTIEQFKTVFRSERGASFDSDMAIDDFRYDQIVGDDLAMTSISSPTGSFAIGAVEFVTVVISNNGLNPQVGFALQYDVNQSGSPTVEVYTGPVINSGFTGTHTFATPLVVTAGPNVIDATVLLGDPTPGNDTASKTINGIPTINSYPYFEDFESGSGFWLNSGSNDTWAFGTPAKPVMNSASSGVNCWTTGTLNGLYANGEQSQILGPIFDFSSLTTPNISFDIWWECESSYDGLTLQSSIDGGTTWQTVGVFGDPNNWYNNATIVGLPGGQGNGWSGRTTSSNGSNGWVSARHDLPSLAGQANVLLRFAFGTDGSVQGEGIAIDDIRIFEPQAGPGQAPQPGLAVLDINNSIDVLNMSFGVPSGINGPFTTSVVAGSALNFSFRGAPNQAIVLLAGPTNAALVNFPGLGQFDIGTGLGGNGIPTGIVLVGDGTQVNFPNVFYNTNANGDMDLSFSMPALPLGYFTTFQGLMFTGGPTVVAFTNAVELHAL
ncbi:MAG: immune inhibitor A, partial [Planctomycetes bacterium]|nr:immune inhibitor A [Planctomycetota bacterium]